MLLPSALAKDVTLQGLWNVFDSYWAGAERMVGDEDPNRRAAPPHAAPAAPDVLVAPAAPAVGAGASAESAGDDAESGGADLGAALSAAVPALEPTGADHSPLISAAPSPIALDDIEELEDDDDEEHGGHVLCEPLRAEPHANSVIGSVAPELAESVACPSSPLPSATNVVDRRAEIQAKLEHVRWEMGGQTIPPVVSTNPFFLGIC